MGRVAVDIDGVIASKLESGVYPRDYVIKEPIPLAKEALTHIKGEGHVVILFTARFEEDREVTEGWLERHGFKGLYDELIMGKPHYDILIDDRALRFEDDWNNTMHKFNAIKQKGWY